MGSEQPQSQGSQVLATKGAVISPLSFVILPLKFLSGLKISFWKGWPLTLQWEADRSQLPGCLFPGLEIEKVQSTPSVCVFYGN